MTMNKILVTGPIASGKSEVCRYLETNGYPVYDSDSRAKALYSSVPGLKEKIEKELGVEFGDLSVIFEDESKRLKLEEIVHPLVLEDFSKWAEKQESDTVIFESAIALDKPLFDGVFDYVILIRAPYGQRLERNSKVAERDRLQNAEESRADFIIDNDSDLDTLHNKTEKIIRTYKERKI